MTIKSSEHPFICALLIYLLSQLGYESNGNDFINKLSTIWVSISRKFGNLSFLIFHGLPD